MTAGAEKLRAVAAGIMETAGRKMGSAGRKMGSVAESALDLAGSSAIKGNSEPGPEPESGQ